MTEKKFHDFRVISREPAGPQAQETWLDGTKLLGVTHVETTVDVNDVARIRIEFIAGSLNKEEPPPGKTDWVIETETKP